MIAFALLVVAYAAPLLLAALGEVFAERAGVVNIGLEGLMLSGALVGVLVSVQTGSPYAGALAAALGGASLASVFALFAVGMKRDQVIVGTTINFLALGLTGVLFRAWLTAKHGAPKTPTLPELFLGFDALTVLALLLVPVSQWILARTRLGVAIRAAGEKPAAAAAAGYAVNRLRGFTVVLTGALCGLGGASLSLGLSDGFTEEMTGGRGFIALAVVVFGRWSPFGALGAALVFAAADVGQARLQAMGVLKIPYPLFLMLPYVLTLVALAVRGARVRPPAALGQPFEQG